MNSFLSKKKVAVLCGGPSSEREVSLRSGSAVTKALRALGANAYEIDVQGGDFHLPDGTELAFNALHGTFGEDGQLQKVLEHRGIAYTGDGVNASEIAIPANTYGGTRIRMSLNHSSADMTMFGVMVTTVDI